MSATKEQALMQAIQTTIQDKEIKKYPDLMEILNKASKQLSSSNNYHQVSATLNKSLQFWGMGHLHGPIALNALYQATIDGTRGRAHQKLPTGFN